MKKGLILLSGGLDSAVVLWWAKHKKLKLATVSFIFPGRRRKELAAARKIRRLAGSKENYEVRLPFLSSPKSEEACYIPQRNLMFYGIAASLAEKIGAGFILGGHIRHDGEVFPDAQKSVLNRIERLIHAGRRESRKIRMLFPFINQGKKVMIHVGSRLKTPFEATWSCSRNGKKHCWKCNSCRERRLGFEKAGVKDRLYGN